MGERQSLQGQYQPPNPAPGTFESISLNQNAGARQTYCQIFPLVPPLRWLSTTTDANNHTRHININPIPRTMASTLKTLDQFPTQEGFPRKT